MNDVRVAVSPSTPAAASPAGGGVARSVLSALAAAMLFATAADGLALILHVIGVMPLLP